MKPSSQKDQTVIAYYRIQTLLSRLRMMKKGQTQNHCCSNDEEAPENKFSHSDP